MLTLPCPTCWFDSFGPQIDAPNATGESVTGLRPPPSMFGSTITVIRPLRIWHQSLKPDAGQRLRLRNAVDDVGSRPSSVVIIYCFDDEEPWTRTPRREGARWDPSGGAKSPVNSR
jgi:hypothetical protein